eukprot:scaffold1817_cov95-Isochrysis_galbana.AAC.4
MHVLLKRAHGPCCSSTRMGSRDAVFRPHNSPRLLFLDHMQRVPDFSATSRAPPAREGTTLSLSSLRMPAARSHPGDTPPPVLGHPQATPPPLLYHPHGPPTPTCVVPSS